MAAPGPDLFPQAVWGIVAALWFGLHENFPGLLGSLGSAAFLMNIAKFRSLFFIEETEIMQGYFF